MNYILGKLSRSFCLMTILSIGLWGCVGGGGTTTGATGKGGTSSSGGSAQGGTTSSGGTVSSGGSVGTGGSIGSGGMTGSGGVQGTGGTTSVGTGGRNTGGNTGSGGSAAGGTQAGTGGVQGSGGSTAGGGTTGTGGRTAGSGGAGTGGATGAGGTAGRDGGPDGRIGTGGSTGSGGGTGAGGSTGGCVKGPTKGKEVCIIGESFIDMGTITQELEKDATAAGSLASGDHYDDNAVSGTLLGNDQIPSQYRQCVKDDTTVKYVFMDGGGNDCIANNPDPALTAATSLFQTMATDKTEKVVYFFYPDPVGSNWASLKTCLDSLRPKMKAICDGLTTPKCYWLDLRTTWNGHSEYTSDGIHPTASGSKATADAIWKVAVDNCVAQ